MLEAGYKDVVVNQHIIEIDGIIYRTDCFVSDWQYSQIEWDDDDGDGDMHKDKPFSLRLNKPERMAEFCQTGKQPHPDQLSLFDNLEDV